MRSRTTVSRLVHELQNGNRAALDELFPLIYEELRARAPAPASVARRHHAQYHRARARTLFEARRPEQNGIERPRALFCRGVKGDAAYPDNYAREHRAKKRGDGATRVSLDEMTLLPEEPHTQLSEQQADMLAELDEALRCLEQVDQRRSEVVECRFTGE